MGVPFLYGQQANILNKISRRGKLTFRDKVSRGRRGGGVLFIEAVVGQGRWSGDLPPNAIIIQGIWQSSTGKFSNICKSGVMCEPEQYRFILRD